MNENIVDGSNTSCDARGRRVVQSRRKPQRVSSLQRSDVDGRTTLGRTTFGQRAQSQPMRRKFQKSTPAPPNIAASAAG
jgi:hypothetical protein